MRCKATEANVNIICCPIFCIACLCFDMTAAYEIPSERVRQRVETRAALVTKTRFTLV